MSETKSPPHTSKRLLEPNERISEVLFGLIMVLTFTGSLSVVEAGREDVRTMLIGALGCNVAWGVIDGILYLMGCLTARGQAIRSMRALREAASPAEAQRAIASVLPPMVAAGLGPEEYQSLREKLIQLPDFSSQLRLGKRDWLSALSVALWVILATFPVALPFILLTNVRQALRLSNLIAIVLLFLTGYAFGRVAECRPWRSGLVVVIIGCVLVALTIALGG